MNSSFHLHTKHRKEESAEANDYNFNRTLPKLVRNKPKNTCFEFVLKKLRPKRWQDYLKANQNWIIIYTDDGDDHVPEEDDDDDNEEQDQNIWGPIIKRVKAHHYKFRSLKFLLRSTAVNTDLETVMLQYAKYFHDLRQLQIWIEEGFYLSDESLGDIGAKIRGASTNLQHFKLYLDGCENVSTKGIKAIMCEITKNLLNLKKLEIEFFDCENFNDRGLSIIVSKICRNLFKLQYLSLEFSLCNQLTDEGLKTLDYKHFRNLNDLKFLKMTFKGCSFISSKGIERLGAELYNKSVQVFHLSFEIGEWLHDDTVQFLKEVGMNIAMNLTALEHLVIKVQGIGAICSKIYNEVKHNFQNYFVNLKSLTLNDWFENL